MKTDILYYRFFDIASEIDLKLAANLLLKESSPTTFYFRKENRTMILEQAPLIFSLGSWSQEIENEIYEVQAQGKLWNFGACSIRLTFSTESKTVNEIIEKSKQIESNQVIFDEIQTRLQDILVVLEKSFKHPNIWKDYEDYMIYLFNENPNLAKEELYQLCLRETMPLSAAMKSGLEQGYISYGQNDFCLIDWDSAVIFDEKDSNDICDIIDFAVCQLLELRFYDEVLDKKIDDLYDTLKGKKTSLIGNSYEDLSKEASVYYLEVSGILDKVENSIKVVGDSYYAQVFRIALKRLRLSDWMYSIEKKLGHLARVSEVFSGRVHERKILWMEIIIVVLIAIEVVPIIYRYLF